jgi:hypothetical protein
VLLLHYRRGGEREDGGTCVNTVCIAVLWLVIFHTHIFYRSLTIHCRYWPFPIHHFRCLQSICLLVIHGKYSVYVSRRRFARCLCISELDAWVINHHLDRILVPDSCMKQMASSHPHLLKSGDSLVYTANTMRRISNGIDRSK